MLRIDVLQTDSEQELWRKDGRNVKKRVKTGLKFLREEGLPARPHPLRCCLKSPSPAGKL
jgi:hypothetical protein